MTRHEGRCLGWCLGALVAACGAGERPFLRAVSNDNAPGSTSETDTNGARAHPMPTERAVLIDGVREGRILDELEGWRLVGGAGSVALVGPDGHVRASHRFAFGGDGATAVFLDRDQVIVGNGDTDGFLGPWAGQLVRWHLDVDFVELVRRVDFDSPLVARLEGVVLAVGSREGSVTAITRTDFRILESPAPTRLFWASHHPPECLVTDGETTWLARAAPDGTGSVTFTEVNTPFPGLAERPPADGLALSTSLGARGLPVASLAPTAPLLVVGTARQFHVLGPDGIGPERRGSDSVRWRTDRVLEVAGIVHPLDTPTDPSRSIVVDMTQMDYGLDGSPPEIEAYDDWRSEVDDSMAGSTAPPPPAIQPVCSDHEPRRCVRARFGRDREVLDWEFFDGARPRRVIRRLAGPSTVPARGEVVFVGDHARVRGFPDGLVSLVPMAGGREISGIETWVELPSGWVYVDPADPDVLVHQPARGSPVRRRRSGPLGTLAIVDGGRVLVELAGGLADVVRVPSLQSERMIDVSGRASVSGLRCEGRQLVTLDREEPVDGACPVDSLDPERAFLVTLSADRRFWLDARLGDEVVVHRRIDDAFLRVRVTTSGVVVSGPGGVFEGRGEVLEHLVVREPGPVREASITVGAEARARFERPGLVAAFFSGAPLPTP